MPDVWGGSWGESWGTSWEAPDVVPAPGAGLLHSPAEVVRQLLVDLGCCSEPGGDWPAFAAGEPDKPDAAVTVFDTEGVERGTVMVDGELAEFHGVQVRVRAGTHAEGWPKAREIALALDGAYMEEVTLGDATYRVQCVRRAGPILALGKERGTRRTLFTINALVTLRMLP
jgi:hypothetical protein